MVESEVTADDAELVGSVVVDSSVAVVTTSDVVAVEASGVVV